MSSPVPRAPEPKEVRLGIIQELLKAAQDDDVDTYAASYDSLIEFERELGDFDSAEQVCKVCGCTNEMACPGGCSWVLDDLCSACLAKLAEQYGFKRTTETLEAGIVVVTVEEIEEMLTMLVQAIDGRMDAGTHVEPLTPTRRWENVQQVHHMLSRLQQIGGDSRCQTTRG